MKRISAFICSIMLLLLSALGAVPMANAVGTNLVANPSAEDNTSGKPTAWSADKWGTNTAAFTYLGSGHTGSHSLDVKMSAYSSGDAKWYFTPVSVAASTSYTFSDWYQSGVTTGVDAVVTTTSGGTNYIHLGDPGASSAWKQSSFTFTTPSNAAKLTIYHYIDRVGELTTDDFSLVNNTVTSGPTAPSVSITSPAGGATVSGSVTVTANATDAQSVAGVQFKLDGNAIGSEDTTSPYSAVLDTTGVSNGTHTLSATARNSSGLTTTASETITVSNTVQPQPTPPSISMTSPASGATVSGSVNLSANASDAQGVSSVQFKVDGAAVGSALTAAPYTLTWNSNSVANGSHTVTAVAVNSSNLSTTSSPVMVTVNNTVSPPPTAGNLIANPSVETGTTAPVNWTGDGWGTNSRALTYETTGHTGSRSVKTTITSYSSGDAKWMPDAVTVSPGTTYKYSNWYMANVSTELDAMVTMTNGSVQYYYVTGVPAASSWTQTSAQFTAPAGASSMVIFQVLAKVGYVQNDDFSLTTYTPTQFSRPLVSLTFDDGWRSIHDNGLPLLKKYNMVSTQYLNSQPILGGYPDYMTFQMVKDFAAQGSELAWHTRTHANLTTLSTSAIDTQLSIPSAFLTGINEPASAFTDFATPYGAYNSQVITEIKKFYRSHRSTDDGYNSPDNFDPYNIKVQNILGTTTPAQVDSWINQAISTKTWLVIVYHEVDPSAADPTYAVTPANLDSELNYISHSGITVETVNQALNEVSSQL